jgi:hypothetical protein
VKPRIEQASWKQVDRVTGWERCMLCREDLTPPYWALRFWRICPRCFDALTAVRIE